MSKFQKLPGSNCPTMNALIIYDEFAFAARANAALQRSASHLGQSIKWNVCPWRLDMLKFPQTAEEAFNEAMNGHLVILAGVTAKPFPAWLNDWLEHWAKCRRIDEAALAIIDGATKHTSSLSNISGMSQFAEQRGLGFIVSDLTAAETNLSFSARNLPEYKLPLLSIQPSPVTLSAHHSYHKWGINE